MIRYYVFAITMKIDSLYNRIFFNLGFCLDHVISKTVFPIKNESEFLTFIPFDNLKY